MCRKWNGKYIHILFIIRRTALIDIYNIPVEEEKENKIDGIGEGGKE